MRSPQTSSPSIPGLAHESGMRPLMLAPAPADPVPARATHREEGYTLELLQRALEHYEQLGAVSESTGFLASRSNRDRMQEMLWCLLLDLREALPRVPLRQRKALFLHLVLQRTEEEVAEQLHIARSVLRKRIHGGLVNLRKILGDRTFPLNTRGSVSPLPRQEPRQDAIRRNISK